MANSNLVLGEITPFEIEQTRRYLEDARRLLVSIVKDMSETQWCFRPNNECWSPAEIVEHAVTAQELILGPIGEALASATENPADDPSTIDAIVRAKMPDRSRRFQVPEILRPCGKWTRAESLARLTKSTHGLIERLQSAPGLRQRRVFSPPLNALTDGQHQLMDGYQFILAAGGHTLRHALQISEMKAAPGFPAN